MSFYLSLLLSVVEPTEPELVNPCYAGNHDCDTTAQCIPLEGQAFQCKCATGYRGDGRNCYGIFVSTLYGHAWTPTAFCWRSLPGYTFQDCDSLCTLPSALWCLQCLSTSHAYTHKHMQTKLKTVQGSVSVFHQHLPIQCRGVKYRLDGRNHLYSLLFSSSHPTFPSSSRFIL